jgi:hypothetical protein
MESAMRSTDNPQSPQPESVSALSITHILASALAAVTATFAASYFGVSGTIIGAALASVVTVVGNTLYSHSIQRTRQRVRSVVPLPTLGMASKAVADPSPGDTTAASPPRRIAIPWRRVAVGAAGLFMIVAAIVTGIEIAAGRPLHSIVHDHSGSGTSLFGGSHKSPTTPTTPAPSQSSTSSSSTTPASTPSDPSTPVPGTTSGPPSSGTPTTPAPTATLTTSPPPDGTPSATPSGG